MVKTRGAETGKLVRLTAPEREAIRIAASFILAGQDFDKAALSLGAIPTRATRFTILPISKEEAVLVVGGTLVARCVWWLRILSQAQSGWNADGRCHGAKR